MGKIDIKRKTRNKRRVSIRKKILGTDERPRLAVFRSNKHIYCQLINDVNGKTLAAVSSNSSEIKSKEIEKGKISVAKEVGLLLSSKAKQNGFTTVVFDRGGFCYHGRVKALADGAREGGLVF